MDEFQNAWRRCELIQDDDRGFVMQWNNHAVCRVGCLLAFLFGLWLFLAWLVGLLIYAMLTHPMSSEKLLATSIGSLVVAFFWFGLTIAIVMSQLTERIEIQGEHFTHSFPFLRWLGHTRVPLAKVTHLNLVHAEAEEGRESIFTLNVRAGQRRIMIAYWGDAQFKRMIYSRLKEALHRRGCRPDVFLEIES